MDGAAQFAAGNAARARELLAWAVASGEDFGAHPFVQTRLLGSPSALSGVTVRVGVSVRVTVGVRVGVSVFVNVGVLVGGEAVGVDGGGGR